MLLVAAAACAGSPRKNGPALATPSESASPAPTPPAVIPPGAAPAASARDPSAPLLEGGRYSYCDPAAAIAAYPRFTATPDAVANVYPLGGARKYPVIDAHTHLTQATAAEAEIQRRAGVYAAVDASWDAGSTARIRATYPRPNVVQFNLGEYLAAFSADAVPAILAHFAEQRAAGAGGIKLFKALGLEIDDVGGVRLRIDDPRLAPIWRRAAQERWTVSIHTADPYSWLVRYYANSPYSKQDLVKQFINVVAAHPGTVFVAIHLLNLTDAEEELDQLGEFLDVYPTLSADVAARSQELVKRDQAHVRTFVIRHQDQLLFATDRVDEADPVTGYQEEFKYWESSLPARGYYQNFIQTGLGLPPDVLEKLYYKNALRAFCSALPPAEG